MVAGGEHTAAGLHEPLDAVERRIAEGGAGQLEAEQEEDVVLRDGEVVEGAVGAGGGLAHPVHDGGRHAVDRRGLQGGDEAAQTETTDAAVQRTVGDDEQPWPALAEEAVESFEVELGHVDVDHADLVSAWSPACRIGVPAGRVCHPMRSSPHVARYVSDRSRVS